MTAETREEAGVLVDEHKVGLTAGWHSIAIRGELFPLQPRDAGAHPA